MCREQGNSQEVKLAFNQIRRRANNLLFDLHEWKHYSKHNPQLGINKTLETAEDKFEEALKALEEVLKTLEIPPKKEQEDITITVISK